MLLQGLNLVEYDFILILIFLIGWDIYVYLNYSTIAVLHYLLMVLVKQVSTIN